jgi:6-phosphogluconate dehydrogenase
MQLGMIGLGRMGANMARRLMHAGHECVVNDTNADSIAALVKDGAVGAKSLDAMVKKLKAPRAIWIMVPHEIVDTVIAKIAPLLKEGDILIDGGNSNYADDVVRAEHLSARGIRYVDVGVSGGIWGLEHGYCLMIGGEKAVVKHLDPIFKALVSDPKACLHCGPVGAGHFVKMVHNGIEYGMMAAYAEGFNVLANAPGYSLDTAKVAEVWRHGSVVRSWLLDLTAGALAKDPKLKKYEGFVSDSGEGRWTVQTAIDAAVPTPVLSAALYSRFSSRGQDDFANKLLSAMRAGFGGHRE